MRIYTPAGDLPFQRFTFPDGQRHFALQAVDLDDWRYVTIETAIRNGDELLDVLLARDALAMSGYIVSLDIRYLLAARMDRRIDVRQPATLELVAKVLNAAGFRRVRILDPHSPVALTLLGAAPVYPVHAVSCVLSHYSAADSVIISPDFGASLRVGQLVALATDEPYRIVQGVKHRVPQTGRLYGFDLEDNSAVDGKHCLIVDDICDGGGTFAGLADVLRARGARSVALYVTHGIFSKGGAIPGVDTIYTTDSYQALDTMPVGPIVIKVSMQTAEAPPQERHICSSAS